ncbi:NADH:flavin oxidoreductase [Enterovibrio makurazakiensis]|uniref:oxidoreductase n=1 Tax=Enterovibrio makurazakiensis TaxID=2910232 RepID=UPI003D201E3F
MSQFDAIFQPLAINKLMIRNRVISTAHAEVYSTENGMPTERYIQYYEEKAKGGIGLCVCGGSSPVSIDSPQGWWKSVNMASDDVVPHLQNLADAMHKHGAHIMIQITHMGRRSRWDGGEWPSLMSPSGIREPVHRATCKTIEPEEIWRIIGDFAKATKRAKDGGLDGVELSFAHQHLVDQFWSPRVNKRTDEWGGSFENRMRFGVEILKAVREEVGPDYAVGIRMTGDEFHPDGLNQYDMKEIAAYYDSLGMIDFFSIVGSGCDTHNTLANVIPNMTYPPEPFIHLAAGIRSVVNVPVMHAQNIKDPVQAARALESGLIDFVGMTRAHLADPHLIAKVKLGQTDQIRQCVGANYCIDRQYQGIDVLCIQNAATSREQTMPHIIQKTDGPIRKVVIVGGGPAGMEAARVCAERGHQVTLFEKNSELGGQITIASQAPQREQIAGITRWFDLELRRLGVNLVFDVTADETMIAAENADVVLLAVGGKPFVNQMAEWGAEDGLVVSSWDLLSGAVEPGKNVVVYDTICEFSGMSVADFLAAKGARVELVTDDIKPGVAVGGTSFPTYYRSLYTRDVVMTSDLVLEKVYKEGEAIIAHFENEYTGVKEERVVDQVVIENGVRPDEALYYAFKDGSRNKGQIDIEALFAAQPQPIFSEQGDGYLLYRLGDCNAPRNIHAAIYDALRLCKDL